MKGRRSQQKVVRKTSGLTPCTYKNTFAVALQMHNFILLITLFSNLLQNLQSQKRIASNKIWCLLSLLKICMILTC